MAAAFAGSSNISKRAEDRVIALNAEIKRDVIDVHGAKISVNFDEYDARTGATFAVLCSFK